MKSLSQIVIVLHEPQDDINIGNTVRAAKNFGIRRVRLVNPASGDPHRISISAPKAEDVIGSMERFESIDDALVDCVYVVGMTARRRRASWTVVEPRGAARDAVQMTGQGTVAIVFGREDSGLPNEILDRCHGVVTIPTDPDYSSLNLGQAVLLMVWEIFRMAEGVEELRAIEPETVRLGDEDLATMERLERVFAQAEEALHAIEFFKTESTDHIMRGLRNVFLRARLDQREAALFHGIFKEIVAFMKRTGRDA
ncbi:MAG: RNA methyltransferase [Bradymonadaceae bacterium]